MTFGPVSGRLSISRFRSCWTTWFRWRNHSASAFFWRMKFSGFKSLGFLWFFCLGRILHRKHIHRSSVHRWYPCVHRWKTPRNIWIKTFEETPHPKPNMSSFTGKNDLGHVAKPGERDFDGWTCGSNSDGLGCSNKQNLLSSCSLPLRQLTYLSTRPITTTPLEKTRVFETGLGALPCTPTLTSPFHSRTKSNVDDKDFQVSIPITWIQNGCFSPVLF